MQKQEGYFNPAKDTSVATINEIGKPGEATLYACRRSKRMLHGSVSNFTPIKIGYVLICTHFY